MVVFKDKIFCPEKFAAWCSKGNTCERAWSAKLEEESQGWKVLFCSNKPGCFKALTLTAKQLRMMNKE